MPNAILSTQLYAGDGTQTGLINAIETAMLAVGYEKIHSYVLSGNQFIIFRYIADATETYGTAFIEVSFGGGSTPLVIRGFAGYDPALSLGNFPNTTTVSKTISSLSSNFTIYRCEHPEIRGISIMEGISLRTFIGYFRPSPVPSWWDENVYPCFFMERGTGTVWDTNRLQTISSLKPTIADNNSVSLTPISAPSKNPQNNNFVSMRTAGMVGGNAELFTFSNDCILAGAEGMSMFELWNNNYAFFDGSSASVCRFGVKIA